MTQLTHFYFFQPLHLSFKLNEPQCTHALMNVDLLQPKILVGNVLPRCLVKLIS